VLSDVDPDYMVLGETRTYSFEAITRAVRLVNGGARFIATNPDPTGPSPAGPLPATGSVAAMISKATGRTPHRGFRSRHRGLTSTPPSRNACRAARLAGSRPAQVTSAP
jgi:hypothetical protein